MKNGFFGTLFDMNHNGELDAGEQFMDFMMFEQLMEEEKEEEYGCDYDDDNDTEEEESEWQSTAESNIYNISPYDYSTEEKYNEAVENKEEWIMNIPDKVQGIADDFGINAADYDSYYDFTEAVKDSLSDELF